MKTPDEIKKGILCDGPCNECAYRINIMSYGGCSQAVVDDTIAYIEQLERERNAAVEILRSMHCDTCIYDEHDPIPNVCFDCIEDCNWEWREVKEE